MKPSNIQDNKNVFVTKELGAYDLQDLKNKWLDYESIRQMAVGEALQEANSDKGLLRK